jgi:microcystin-dependent protein
MAFAYAGLYGPQTILDQTSKELANVLVTVYESNGTTAATLYTDHTMTTTASNPVSTDSLGNLIFWTIPGSYILSFVQSGVATTLSVVVTPWVQEPAWGPGRIEDYAGAAAPAGYLLCDGSAISRSSYADLFSAIGTTWGSGDGSTTFNVPDLRGRSTIGTSSIGSNSQPSISIAQVGGEADHTLSFFEMPTHNHADAGHAHGVSDPSHNHVPQNTAVSFVVTASSSTLYAPTSGSQAITFLPGTNASATGISVNTGAASIQNSGNNGAHNNLHPYAGVTKIVRY